MTIARSDAIVVFRVVFLSFLTAHCGCSPTSEEFSVHIHQPEVSNARPPETSNATRVAVPSDNGDGTTKRDIAVLRDTFGNHNVNKITRSSGEGICVSNYELPIGDEQLAMLSETPQIKELHLFYGHGSDSGGVTNNAIPHICRLLDLEVLTLYDTAVTEESLDQLFELPKLASLALGRMTVTESGLRAFEHARLEELQIVLESDADLIYLTNQSLLRKLEVSLRSVDGEGLRHLGDMPLLQSVQISSGRNIEWLHMAGFSNVAHITELNLSGCKFHDCDFAPLGKLTSLKTLILTITDVSDLQILALASLQNLETLDLRGTMITGSTLDSLNQLPKLRSLNLSETRIGDASLKHVSNLPNLERLDLHATNVTIDGLKHLTRCGQLKHLDIVDCQNISTAELEVLAKIPNLSTVVLRDAERVATARKKFSTLQPKLKVIEWSHRRPNDSWRSLQVSCN